MNVSPSINLNCGRDHIGLIYTGPSFTRAYIMTLMNNLHHLLPSWGDTSETSSRMGKGELPLSGLKSWGTSAEPICSGKFIQMSLCHISESHITCNQAPDPDRTDLSWLRFKHLSSSAVLSGHHFLDYLSPNEPFTTCQ